MDELNLFLEDPRRRNLALLAAVAVVVVLLAALGLARQASETARREYPEPLFPGLLQQADRIAQIRVQSRNGTVEVVFKPEKTWVIANHDDYPASHDVVRETVIGLAALTTLEKKTARRDWLPYLDLVSPTRGGGGTEITLLDDKGGVIAAVITGKTADIGDPSGAIGLFVRKPGDPQSWLARSVFQPKSGLDDWLDKDVMAIDRARIAETDVDPFSGPSYVVRRDKPSDADFKLAEMPKGRELAYDGAPDGIAAADVDFSFDDVKPAKNFDFSDLAHTARVITKTFDGLTVTVSLVRQGQDIWATVSAEGANADAAREARAIDAHASGWAYKLPAYKGQQFTTSLESLLKPLGTAAPAH